MQNEAGQLDQQETRRLVVVDRSAQTVYSVCMATKTISVSTQAYDRLRTARKYATESFSQVILRAAWPEQTITARELLARLGTSLPLLSETALDRIEAAKSGQQPPEGKWTAR
jgi:predicted CopG family antitoxin